MNKNALPREFPVGRLRGLLHSVSPAARHRSPFLPRPQLISPYGGPVPKHRSLQDLWKDQRNLAARNEGTLGQFVAAKDRPTAIRSQPGPQLSTASIPPDIQPNVEVRQGTGAVRDADVSKAAWAREAVKTSVSKGKAVDPRILAVDPSERHLLPALSLQAGMGEARKLMWKHMSPVQRSNYLLRKTVPPSQP